MIKIEINCEPEALEAHMRALRYFPIIKPVVINAQEPQPEGGDASEGQQSRHTEALETSPGVLAGARVPGKPKTGHRQRTKAEIEEDEKHFAAQQRRVDITAGGSGYASEPAETVAAERTAAAIDPQDETDEQAESGAKRTDKLTRDDVRTAVEHYSAAHGIPAAIENIPKLLGRSVADLPDDQAVLREAIDKIDWAAAQPKDANPIAKETAKPNGAAKATREDVVAAIKRYAKKYDGQDADLSKIPNTNSDVAATLKKTFGDKVTKLSEIPATPEGYGAALVAIDDALAKNTFGRAAK
jgi:hypothetical protein